MRGTEEDTEPRGSEITRRNYSYIGLRTLNCRKPFTTVPHLISLMIMTSSHDILSYFPNPANFHSFLFKINIWKIEII